MTPATFLRGIRSGSIVPGSRFLTRGGREGVFLRRADRGCGGKSFFIGRYDEDELAGSYFSFVSCFDCLRIGASWSWRRDGGRTGRGRRR